MTRKVKLNYKIKLASVTIDFCISFLCDFE